MHLIASEELLTENLEPVQKPDLIPGASLMMEQNGKVYPVTYIKGLLCVFCVHAIHDLLPVDQIINLFI